MTPSIHSDLYLKSLKEMERIVSTSAEIHLASSQKLRRIASESNWIIGHILR